MFDWLGIDHVFLDMDGTLLDLHYDNTVWNELLPQHYAAQQAIDVASARAQLLEHMSGRLGTIEFYDLDYWRRFTQLDIMAPHRQATALIAWRPDAREFVRQARRLGKQTLLVTNAHPESIEIKDQHSAIVAEMDGIVSAHEFGHPKESREFWQSFRSKWGFEPSRALFIDDNDAVLQAARDFGIGKLLTIVQPDSARPDRTGLNFPAINGFDGLLAGMPV